MRTLWPLPCSGEPTPPEGMCSSIISRVTKPVACDQFAGGLLSVYCKCQPGTKNITELDSQIA